MPIYDDVETLNYYPNPEQKTRSLFQNIQFYSILDVGAGHGGVFDIDRWNNDPLVTKKEACDLFWIRETPGWILKTGINVENLDEFYQENEFDFVQCTEVLEHVPNPRKALEQLIKVAKKAVFITSADEMHHLGPEQEAIEKINKHQAYIAQPKIEDLKQLGFNVRVDSDTKRQIIAWLIKS